MSPEETHRLPQIVHQASLAISPALIHNAQQQHQYCEVPKTTVVPSRSPVTKTSKDHRVAYVLYNQIFFTISNHLRLNRPQRPLHNLQHPINHTPPRILTRDVLPR